MRTGYGLQIADMGVEEAVNENEALRRGVNVYAGEVRHKGVADAFGMDCCEL